MGGSSGGGFSGIPPRMQSNQMITGQADQTMSDPSKKFDFGKLLSALGNGETNSQNYMPAMMDKSSVGGKASEGQRNINRMPFSNSSTGGKSFGGKGF